MTKVLTDGTDQLLRATCSEAMREAEKAEGATFQTFLTSLFVNCFMFYKLLIIAEPKLLAKSSALAALSSLGRFF